MSNTELARRLIDTLKSAFSPELFNPWRDHCTDCKPCNGPDAKLARLAAHLACVPEFILCGEAPSHRGCRHSGIAFTSECLLLSGAIPRMPPMSHRLTTKKRPYKERSATIVWKALYNLGIEERTILWNALPMHPYELENEQSNRTPPPAEVIKFGKHALEMLVDSFPSATVVAVGKTAEGLLDSMGIDYTPVRHPAAYGGATEFTQRLKSLVGGARGRPAVDQTLFHCRPKRTR
jgi:uracil-DNA glycosylase